MVRRQKEKKQGFYPYPYTQKTIRHNSKQRDEAGRRIGITLTQNNAPNMPQMNITNIYTPYNPSRDYFTDLLKWFTTYPMTNRVIGGDFKTTA